MRWFTAVWRHRVATHARWTYRSKESVITFSAWLRCVLISFSQHHLFALIHTCQEADKPRKGTKGRDKSEEKTCDRWMLPCWLTHAFVFQSTSPRTSRSRSLSCTLLCPLKMSPCCVQKKPNVVFWKKRHCFQWLSFTFLCFLHIQFWSDWSCLNVWIKDAFS